MSNVLSRFIAYGYDGGGSPNFRMMGDSNKWDSMLSDIYFSFYFGGPLIRPRIRVPRNYLKGGPLMYNKLHSYVTEEDSTK